MNHKDMKDKLLEKIRGGELEMHSSGYFAFRVALFAFFAVLALIVSVLIFNFIFFSIRISEQSELLGFGPRGFLFFVQMFPWSLFALDVVLIFAAERMLRYFRFGYRNPVLFLALGLLVLSVVLGVLLDKTTPFNDRMLEHAHRRHLGPFSDFYEQAHRPGPPEGGICRCVITTIGQDAVTATNADASSTPLLLQLPPGFATSSLRVGETVFVAGDRDGNILRVFGIHLTPQQSE